MELSKTQREIVNSEEKYIQVIAGAGSGKTFVLTERIKFLIPKIKRHEKILSITFSNRAADEMKGRLLKFYTERELNESVYIGTIHSFCMDIVYQRSSSIGLPNNLHIFESNADRLEIFKNALINIPHLKHSEMDSKKIEELFENIKKRKRNFKFKGEETESLLNRLYKDYDDLMLLQKAIDFDDILIYAYRIFVERPAIAQIYQNIYKHIFVDEAQDLNKAQYLVIKAIAGDSTNLFFVGDPNQSIYKFNDSSPTYMTECFKSDYNIISYSLYENFRSPKAIIEAAKKIEPDYKVSSVSKIDGEIEIKEFENEEDEANWIFNKIECFLNKDVTNSNSVIFNPEQIAVIARNRYVFNALENLLIKKNKMLGKDYNKRVSTSQGDISESNFFKIFDLGLKLLINPSDIIHLERIADILGLKLINFDNFETMRFNKDFTKEIGEKEAKILNEAWIKANESPFKFGEILKIFDKHFCFSSKKEIDYKFELLRNDYFAWEERLKYYNENSNADNRGLSHMMRMIALGIANSPRETGITLSTVHMVKGLEFDIVFIMGLNEGVFPDYRTLNNESLLFEEQHNMFVAITRSMRFCYLSYPKKRFMPWGDYKNQSPSQYIKKINMNF